MNININIELIEQIEMDHKKRYYFIEMSFSIADERKKNDLIKAKWSFVKENNQINLVWLKYDLFRWKQSYFPKDSVNKQYIFVEHF